MNRIYIRNRALAKEILQESEDSWLLYGFGLQTLNVEKLSFRLTKAIFLKNDPVAIPIFLRSIYIVAFLGFCLGLLHTLYLIGYSNYRVIKNTL